MIKNYLLLSVFILTLFLSGTVQAATLSTSTNKLNELKDLKQKTLEKKAEGMAEIASSTKNIKNELKDRIEIKIGKKLDENKIKIANDFEESILSLKDLAARTESRIIKTGSENIDMSSSTLLLALAKEKLILAETELTNFENTLAQEIPPATSTSTSRKNERKTLLKNLNFQGEKVKSTIKTAHKSIVEVIASLKRGLMKKDNSTSTKEEVSTSTNN